MPTIIIASEHCRVSTKQNETNENKHTYYQGIAMGILEAVKKEKTDAAAAKERELKRARSACNVDRPGSSVNNVVVDDSEDGGGCGFGDDDSEDEDDNIPLADLRDKKAEQQLANAAKFNALETQLATVNALVVHTSVIAKKVLKDCKIKLQTGRKRHQLSDFNYGAYKKGKADSSKINLNQNSLK